MNRLALKTWDGSVIPLPHARHYRETGCQNLLKANVCVNIDVWCGRRDRKCGEIAQPADYLAPLWLSKMSP
jgi:hypothetical protein